MEEHAEAVMEAVEADMAVAEEAAADSEVICLKRVQKKTVNLGQRGGGGGFRGGRGGAPGRGRGGPMRGGGMGRGRGRPQPY